jgi:hypothetical protein
MHFHDSRPIRTAETATWNETKKRARAVATPLCAAIQPPKTFQVRGSLPPARFESLQLNRRHPEVRIRIRFALDSEEGESSMPLIPKVGMKQAKKIVSARLDEETHSMLQRYALFLGEATHDYIISESLKRLFKRDREFKEWLEKNNSRVPAELAAKPQEGTAVKHTAKA